MPRALRALLRSYAIYFTVWTALGCFFFTQGLVQGLLAGSPYPWWHYLITWLTGVWLSALLTPGVFWLAHRFPFRRAKWVRRAGLHLLFSLCFSLSQISIHSLAITAAGVFPQVMPTVPAAFLTLAVLGLHSTLLTYWVLLGIRYAIDYYHRFQEQQREALRLQLHSAELRAQLASAHLSTLKTQLQPHFLFNTLNAIMVLVRKQQTREAEQMLALLSDLLRSVLEDVEAQEVPLARELEYLQLYLSIEQIRFADRLKVNINPALDVLDAAFPHMGLQPIVENAIRHGIGRSSSAGRIDIQAYREGESLFVTVRDDGPGLQSEPPSGRGIGLSNTSARLAQLYGDAGELRIENGNRGAIVTMRLPFRATRAATEAEIMELHAFDDAAG
jgi:two-component sensor histidine kinase